MKCYTGPWTWIIWNDLGNDKWIRNLKRDWRGIQHEWERREIDTRFSLKTLKGRDHSEGLGIDGKIILEWIFGK
jgi:hypothetical protein